MMGKAEIKMTMKNSKMQNQITAIAESDRFRDRQAVPAHG